MSDGCARLWAGVISQAIVDMDSSMISERAAAKRWIFFGETRPGSFLWICDHLDLDAGKLQTLCLSRSGRKSLVRNNGSRYKEQKKHDQEDKEVSSETGAV
jgi:hypothetical protein